MEDAQNNVQITSRGEINFAWIASTLLAAKNTILITTFVFAAVAVGYSLLLPDIYKSQAILVAADETAGIGMTGQLGSLAAMAGVNLGKGKGEDKSELAVNILKSKDFIIRFLERHNAAIDLMAAESWDPISRTLRYDNRVYDHSISKWTRKVDAPLTPEPSGQTLHKEFIKIFAVSKDKLTGIITISISHPSPIVARRWLDSMITDINEEVRVRDQKQAEKSINYLTVKASETNLTELRSIFYKMIEEQTKTLLLANVRDEYALKVIDPPLEAEEKSEPKRALIVILFTVIGFLLSVVVVLLRASAVRR